MNDDENSVSSRPVNHAPTTASSEPALEPGADAITTVAASRRSAPHDGREDALLERTHYAALSSAYQQWRSFAATSSKRRKERQDNASAATEGRTSRAVGLARTNERKIFQQYFDMWSNNCRVGMNKQSHHLVAALLKAHVDCQTDFDDSLEATLREMIQRRHENFADSCVQAGGHGLANGDESFLLMDASGAALLHTRREDTLHALLVKRSERLAKGRDELLAATLHKSLPVDDAAPPKKLKKKKSATKLPKLSPQERRRLEREAAADDMACRYRVVLPALPQRPTGTLGGARVGGGGGKLEPLARQSQQQQQQPPRSLTAPPVLEEDVVSWSAESPTQHRRSAHDDHDARSSPPKQRVEDEDNDSNAAAKKLAKDIYLRPSKAHQLGLQDLFALEKKILDRKKGPPSKVSQS